MSINFLKIIALLCMIIDHIGEFIPNSSMWFRYIGRLAAPIFSIVVYGDFIIHVIKKRIFCDCMF